MFEMISAGLSDTGLARKKNEDAFYIHHPLLIVADGMGGAAAGEIASSIAIEAVSSSLSDEVETLQAMSLPDANTSDKEITAAVRKAILKADTDIKERTQQNPELKGMGTTIVVCLHLGDRLLIGHVGDSRAYMLTQNSTSESPVRKSTQFNSTAETAVLQAISADSKKPTAKEDSIRRITEDHSVVMDLVKTGVITEDEIRTHPMRNRITRCVGIIAGQGPDFVWHTIEGNETLIMCSDGLWEMVYEELILAIVKSSSSLEEACKRLVHAANEKGGVDNITVVAARFTKK